MVTLTATGPIYSISPVIEIPPKNGGTPFQKRELVIDDTWVDRDNNAHPNFVLIEFTGDKMAQLDQFAPGQRVTVEAFINGRAYNGKVFNTIKGRSVAHYQPQTTTGQQGQYATPAPSYPQQPQQPQYPQVPGYPAQGAYPPGGYPQQPAYPQPTAYPSQGGYAQPPAPAPMPGTPQGGNLGPEGLPFR